MVLTNGFCLGRLELLLHRVHAHQLTVLERMNLFRDQDWWNETRNRLRETLKKKEPDDKAVSDQIASLTATRDQRSPVRSNLLSFTNDKYERLADPYNPQEPLEARARAYLHSNCAMCHVEAGGGNAQMQLDFVSSLEKMKVLDQAPHHDKFGLPDARLIAPGHPERSVLLHRMSIRGRGQMPQLATTVIDKPAVEMLTEWIKQLPAK